MKNLILNKMILFMIFNLILNLLYILLMNKIIFMMWMILMIPMNKKLLNPMIINFIIISFTIIMTINLNIYLKSNWFPFITLLIMIGGMMILFLYFNSFLLNWSKFFNYNFLLNLFIKMFFMNFIFMIFLNNISFNIKLNYLNINNHLMFILKYPSNLILIMLIMLLLFLLFIITYLCKSKNYAIRKFY